MIQPPTKPERAVDQLQQPAVVAGFETGAEAGQGAVGQFAFADRGQNLQSDATRGGGFLPVGGSYDSIPVVGLDGTARSRFGMRPAR